MAENINIKPLILLLVVALVGIVFVREIADSQVEATTLSSVSNESVTISSSVGTVNNETGTLTGRRFVLSRDSIVNVTFFGNNTNNTNMPEVRFGTEVNFTRAGVITVSGSPDKFTGAGPYNASYTFTTNVTGEVTNNDVTAIVFFGNGTINTNAATNSDTIRIGTEVNVTKATGVLALAPSNFSNGNYNVSYNYEGALYVSDSKSHVLLKLLALFFAIALVAFGIVTIRDSSDNFNFGFKK